MAAAASAAALLITGLPLWACWLLGVNTTTLIAYSFDKSAARDRTWRVPEVVLHGLAATGGSPAAWIARPLFSHKTQKAGFARTLGVISLAQIAVGLAIVFLSWHG